MIFLTVGSQMPFDRLVRTVDAWAQQAGVTVEAQIGDSSYTPVAMRWHATLDPADFRRHVADCELLVGHAGMGTVLTAMEFGKPALLLPRLASLRETRNDHQVATLEWLKTKQGIFAAFQEADLVQWLDRFKAGELMSSPLQQAMQSPGLSALVQALNGFIFGASKR